MANRTETIGVRVTAKEKKKFDDYASEHNEFDSASRMMRVLAHRHISGEDEEEVSIDQEDIVDSVEMALGPVVEQIEQMENLILSIDSHVSDDDEIDRLAKDIYASLPVAKDEDELPGVFEIARMDFQSDFEKAQTLSTPETWAEYYEVSVSEARRALSRMMIQFPDAQAVKWEMGGRMPIEESGEEVSVGVSDHRYFKTEEM